MPPAVFSAQLVMDDFRADATPADPDSTEADAAGAGLTESEFVIQQLLRGDSEIAEPEEDIDSDSSAEVARTGDGGQGVCSPAAEKF